MMFGIRIRFVLMFAVGALFLLNSAPTALAEDRALIIGIEYYDRVRPAPGALRDADDVERFAIERLKFPSAAIRKLKGKDATSQGIKDAVIRWLINDTKPGDRVFFYYSGHGSYLPDDDRDETDDKWDETIVPYDVGEKGLGMIRDDQFAKWIADLAGRRIVMIFDSCHSGTISRGGPAPVNSARYILPDDELLAPRMRNLVEVSDGLINDKNRISSQSDVVVISAAGARQTAHSMLENNQWRGGLTKCLLESYGNGAPKLGDLEASINARIKQLQSTKRPNGQPLLAGEQIPEFATSNPRLRNEPLFGLWESVPAIALVNPRSQIKVGLTTNDANRRKNADGHLVYYEGESISYTISTDKPGYLYLLAFSQNPETKERYVTMLFPHKDVSLNNEINPPQLHLPDHGTITASGLDVTVALVTTKKLNFQIKDRYSWEELFNLLDLKELQQEVAQLMRGVEVKPRVFDWQAFSLPIFTTRK
ncbi:MAG: caspase family protein [Blastocatellales bacterium]